MRARSAPASLVTIAALVATMLGTARVSMGDSGSSATPQATTGPTATTSIAAALAAVVANGDDARKSVVIGAGGEVYEPDGKGAWVRRQRISTANPIALAARAGDAVIAWGDGIVYRLAVNGWSAIRLHQKERAVMSVGSRAIAAVGRQLFAIDKSVNGEPAKLAIAPSNVIAIGAGPRGVIVQLDRGLFRVQGAGLAAIANAPQQISRVVSDRWVLVDGGAIDLNTGRKTGFPPTVVIAAAAAMEDDRLVLVARDRSATELVTIIGDRIVREVIDPSVATVPFEVAGVVSDKSGRAVIALRDGRLLVRGESVRAGGAGSAGTGVAASGTWVATQVTEELPPAKRGAPPAVSR